MEMHPKNKNNHYLLLMLAVLDLISINLMIHYLLLELNKVIYIYAQRLILGNILNHIKGIYYQYTQSNGINFILMYFYLAVQIGWLKCGIKMILTQLPYSIFITLSTMFNGHHTHPLCLQQYHHPLNFTYMT